MPEKSHEERSLAGYSPWDLKTVRHDLATKQQQTLVKVIKRVHLILCVWMVFFLSQLGGDGVRGEDGAEDKGGMGCERLQSRFRVEENWT